MLFQIAPFLIDQLELDQTGDGEAVFKDIQILKAGTFIHPDLGRFELTERDFDLFIKHFNAKVHKTDPALNLNHKKEEAAGWIRSLEKRNGGRELWANTELTDLGVEKIRSKRFRYISAEISFTYRDNETGEKFSRVLTGAALTNIPFIRGMNSVEFANPERDNNPERDTPMLLSEITKELRSHGFDFEDIQAKARKYVDLEAKVKTVEAELTAERSKSEAAEKKAQVAEAALEAVKKQANEAKFEELKTRGIKEGKLTKAFAEAEFKTIFDAQGAEFAEKMLAGMSKVVRTETTGHGGDDTERTL